LAVGFRMITEHSAITEPVAEICGCSSEWQRQLFGEHRSRRQIEVPQ
jgi:hypothetical protein